MFFICEFENLASIKQKEEEPDKKTKVYSRNVRTFEPTMHKQCFGGFVLPSSSDVDTSKSPQGELSPISYPSASNPHQGRVGGYTPSTQVSYGSVVQSVYVLPLYTNGNTHGLPSIVLRWSGSQLGTLSSGSGFRIAVQSLQYSQSLPWTTHSCAQEMPSSSTPRAHQPAP